MAAGRQFSDYFSQPDQQSEPPPISIPEIKTEHQSTHPLLANVVLQLDAKELWDQFHMIGTEMIVTKAGRLVFS